MDIKTAVVEMMTGKCVRNKNWAHGDSYISVNRSDCTFVDENNNKYTIKLDKPNDLIDDNWEFYEKSILTEDERSYLRDVINCLGISEIKYIEKDISRYDNECEALIIVAENKYFKTWEHFGLPAFPKGTKFVRMNACTKYTAKDLDL